MDIGNNQGEGLAIKLAAARAVGAYSDSLNHSDSAELSEKMKELLRTLIIENLKEGVTDEQMEDLLYQECESKRLDPEEVMKHFTAISENLKSLLG